MRKGLSEAAAKWKELPEPEKTKYNEKYLAMKKKFDEELSAWTAKITAQGKMDLFRSPAKTVAKKPVKPKKRTKKASQK